MSDPKSCVSDAISSDVESFLEEAINTHNFEVTGIRDGRSLGIVLRTATGEIEAGLSGHTWGGVCDIRHLWVAPASRGSGLGSRILCAAEVEAERRGCTKVVLSTHSFQAPDFYKKQGYEVVGEVVGYPRGHSQIFLEKNLPRACN